MKRLLKLIACFLIIVCGLSVVACSIQKDTNISSIEIIEETIPETIVTGKFDEAGIKAKINYEDGSTETITLTTELLPVKYRALVNVPGNYEITIILKGQETKLNITIINPDQYLVNFYNANGLLISTQFVEAGKDALPPSEELAKVDGLEFIGWDRLTTNITEDTNIYGVYASIDSTHVDINKMFNSLLTAQENLKTTSHYTNFISYYYGDIETVSHGYVVYNYNEKTKISTSYGEETSTMGHEKFSYDEEYFDLSIKYLSGEEYINSYSYAKMAEDYASILDFYGDFNGYLTQSKLYAGYTFFPIDYMLKNYAFSFTWKEAENRDIYTITFTYNDEFEKLIYNITFDNNNIYSVKQYCFDAYTNEPISTTEFYHDYKMPEVEIKNPFVSIGDVNFDGEINIRDSAEILLYLNDKKDLYNFSKKNADVNQDGFINMLDFNLILDVVTNKITLEEAKNFISGDVDRDGQITFKDLIIINTHIANNYLTDIELLLADMNGDNKIDILDLNILADVLNKQNEI